MAAALGAVGKKDPGRDRAIFDATHGALTNHAIRVWGLVELPRARDIRMLLAHLHDRKGPRLGLCFDATQAHRNIPARHAGQ